MSIKPGSQLGAYEVIGLLGAGGMGEVWRARDSKLQRDVAVKALPEDFASDRDRTARFEREAQVLASLNHPNIAAIHELKEAEGSQYLILELVEGETLAERLARGPLAVDEALDIAKQIAEALEGAHEKGIIHRDLKPANVKITPEGRVKVLDFGLAKIYEPLNAAQGLSNSPTLSAMQTMGGVILGTAAYMSPEQARGKTVDKRADVWAFGCVLYEMLAGVQAYANGETASDTLARVLEREPDWLALPAATPSNIRTLIERCLRKDARRRLRDIGDARIEIEEAGSATSTPADSQIPRGARLRTFAGWVASFVLLVALTLLAIRHFGQESPGSRSVQFDVLLPAGSNLRFDINNFELSPDGRMLAYIATGGQGTRIWIRRMDSLMPEQLNSTDDAISLFWAPDSQHIGYVARDQLKRINVNGGPSTLVSTLPKNVGPYGTWNSNDTILLSGEGTLRRVSASGGTPEPLHQPNSSGTESYLFPHFLPDGRHYLFVRSSGNAGNSSLHIGRLDSNITEVVKGITSQAKYSNSGHILFIRSGALMGQSFDPVRNELSGDPFTIDSLTVSSAFAGLFSVSVAGDLAYSRTVTVALLDSQFVWLSKTGKEIGALGLKGPFGAPDLSPDGRYLVIGRFDSDLGIWVFDIRTRILTPISSSVNSAPRWSPDGRIAFSAAREGQPGLYERRFGVVGGDQVIFSGIAPALSDWSSDGKYLAYELSGDVWALPMFGERKPIQITQTPAVEAFPRIAPNGQWIAYESNEPGTPEVYVRSFPDARFVRQVSTTGGQVPRWGPDGGELFYVAPDKTLMSVSVKSSQSEPEFGAPVKLFTMPIAFPFLQEYDVAPDGRFVVNVPPNAAANASPIKVMLNWAETLK